MCGRYSYEVDNIRRGVRNEKKDDGKMDDTDKVPSMEERNDNPNRTNE